MSMRNEVLDINFKPDVLEIRAVDGVMGAKRIQPLGAFPGDTFDVPLRIERALVALCAQYSVAVGYNADTGRFELTAV